MIANAEVERAELFVARGTYGARAGAGDVDRVVSRGTKAWLEEQLRPDRIDDSDVERRLERLENLRLTTTELMAKYPAPTRAEREAMARAREKDGVPRRGPGEVLRDLSEAKLVRAAFSERQLLEVMADFWFNHFNVYARKNRNTLLALPSYEREAIRPHALGRFEDLLHATASAPAMLFYLDNWINTKDGFDPREMLRGAGRRRGSHRRSGASQRKFGVNENYGRELLELHTLGVKGGYTQEDVVEVARAFTGWSVVGPRIARMRERFERRFGRRQMPGTLGSLPPEGSFFFNKAAHDEAPKKVLGERLEAGGIQDGRAVLTRLSRHPSTARFISGKLARKFVSDHPSDALVDEMSDRFRSSGGDIREVLRAMFTSTRFVEEAKEGLKVKSPLELTVSAIRATGAEIRGPFFGRAVAQLGMPLYLCQPPTGYDEEGASWLSAGSLLMRVRFATELASGKLPGVGLTHPPGGIEELAFRLASPEFQRH